MATRPPLAAALLAIAILPLAAAPASAAPPSNDEPQGAVVVRLGERVEQDTSEATTSAQDAVLNESCGAPVTTASVWYSYTPAEDRDVVLDVTASDYSSGLLVFAGTPTAESFVACGQGMVPLRARAGRTYTVMVISDTEVNGGRMVLSLTKAPPPPHVRVTVAARGAAFRGRGGAARIHGTYACRNGLFAGLSARLSQRAGRLKVRAEAGTEIRCDGKWHTWTLELVSPIATYARGRAHARVVVFACGLLACRQDRAERPVTLSWAAMPDSERWIPSRAAGQHPHPVLRYRAHWPGR